MSDQSLSALQLAVLLGYSNTTTGRWLGKGIIRGHQYTPMNRASSGPKNWDRWEVSRAEAQWALRCVTFARRHGIDPGSVMRAVRAGARLPDSVDDESRPAEHCLAS